MDECRDDFYEKYNQPLNERTLDVTKCDIKTAVVTGATGFIESNLVNKLLDEGVRVIAPVQEESVEKCKKLFTGNIKILPLSLEKIYKHPDYINEKVDTFFHFAWKGIKNESLYDPMVQMENVGFLINSIRAAQAINCKRFIGAGSIMQFEEMKIGHSLSLRGVGP